MKTWKSCVLEWCFTRYLNFRICYITIVGKKGSWKVISRNVRNVIEKKLDYSSQSWKVKLKLQKLQFRRRKLPSYLSLFQGKFIKNDFFPIEYKISRYSTYTYIVINPISTFKIYRAVVIRNGGYKRFIMSSKRTDTHTD